MKAPALHGLDRRSFIGMGLSGMALASIPPCLLWRPTTALAGDVPAGDTIEALVRPETLFAGIRKPITERAELAPRIEAVTRACGDRISGPLTHIFRYDTPVEGYDSEIGFPVSGPVDAGEVTTHTLRSMHFYWTLHEGPPETLRETSRKLYQYMAKTGLSPELELVEIFHHRDLDTPEKSRTQVMAAFLAWPEVYRQHLIRVLGAEAAETIWQGGEKLTPHTAVDPRCAWVAASIERLKKVSTLEQQFDILSRVALVRPIEDVMHYKRIYEDSGKDINAVFKAHHEQLEKSPFGSFVDPPRFDGKVLHLSKPPYSKKGYAEAKTHTERRKAYCFCNLIREAEKPRVDPIFCYRAAGWARQFWEPILEVEFKRCVITHSILKGDDFCAWDYHLG